jgi:outer membrane protein assembly factor BamB
LLLGACSSVEKLNPFSSSDPKVKPAELAAIQPTAELKTLWQDNVGSAGEFTFSPAVVGDSVYAAGA